MNKELLQLKRIYRRDLPGESDKIRLILLNIFTLKYGTTESDMRGKVSSYINLSTYFNDSQCINECPLSDTQLLPLYGEASGTARVIYTMLLEISDETPAVTYAPLLFPLASFLNLHMSERETKGALTALLGDTDSLPSSVNDWNVLCHLVPVIGRRFATEAYQALHDSDDHHQMNFWPYSLWSLPLDFLTRVLICYFVEGSKVLLRAGLLLWTETYVRCGSADRRSYLWREALTTTAANIGRTFTPQSFLDQMFRIRNLSHASVARYKRGLAGTLDSGDWISPTTSKGYVAFKTKDANPSRILTPAELIEIVRNLNPFLAQINKPVPLFLSETHGYSLRTLYSVVAEVDTTLLVIETVLKEVIGAFCADPWSLRNRADATRFYGKGECFVFKIRPRPAAIYRWNQDRDNVQANMFQRATSEWLEVGGGGGGTAIRVDASLSRGTSSCNSTFDSPCLTEFSHSDFLIKTLELLAFEEIH